VQATSTDEGSVSAYPTITAAGDSISLILVNRNVSATKSVTLNFNGYSLTQESFQVKRLSNLPATESFNSHTSNALQSSTVTPASNVISLSLPSMSITLLQLKGQKGTVTGVEKQEEFSFNVYPNPTTSKVTVEIGKSGYAVLDVIDLNGKTSRNIYKGEISATPFKTEVDLNGFSKGVYIVRLSLNGEIISRKLVVN
jgi:hypothetical protein